MTEAAANEKKQVQITIGNADVQVSPDGKKISFSGDFNVVLDGVVISLPNGAVLNNTAVAAVDQIGLDVLGDKSIFAGERFGKKIYAAPKDASLTMSFNQAAEYIKKLNKENYLGHSDWRLPTREELNVIYQNKDKGALKDTFNLTGSGSNSSYWSSTVTPTSNQYAYDQSFKTGNKSVNYHLVRSAVRPVRGGWKA